MKKYSTVFLLTTVLAVNIFFRIQTAFLPFIKIMAENTVKGQLSDEAAKDIEEKFKDLSPKIRFRLTQDLLKVWGKERKRSVSLLIQRKYRELKQDYQDENNSIFLLELDPYHWLRLVKNLISTGHIGDKFINGREFDSYMLAPSSMEVEVSLHRNLHIYIASYIYKLCHLFKSDILLVRILFFIPVLISSLVIVVVFFFCRNIGKGNIAGFFASFSLSLAPIFLSRSVAGWFDTDAYIVLFSILIIWGFFSSFTRELTPAKRWSRVFLISLCTALFSFTWDGWWYIFDLVIFASLYYIANLQLLKSEYQLAKSLFKRISLNLVLFFSFSLIFVVLLSGMKIALHFLSGPWDIVRIFKESFWPNTFLTVAELGGSEPIGIINNMGGTFIFLFAIAYMLSILMDKKSPGFIERGFLGFLFSFWVIILYLVSLKARRFSLLLTIPICISFGLFLEISYTYLGSLLDNIIKRKRQQNYLFLGVSSIFIFILINNAKFTRNISPMMNRDWYDLLHKIKEQSPKNSIINSWWDYGHWFKAVAHRPVIFDGATQSTPQAYWMSRVFITDDEDEAIGILRMLNSGGNTAFEKLEKLGFSKYDALQILNGIFKLKEKEANDFLQKYIIDKESREQILKYTFNPQTAYFIVEPSLVHKIEPISFLGGWDFKRADIYQTSKKLKKDALLDYIANKYNHSKKEAADIYNTLVLLGKQDMLDWISPSLNFYSESRNFKKEADTLFFDNGFIVNLTNYSVMSYNRFTGTWQIPKSIFYIDANKIREIVFDKNDLDYSVLLIHDNGSYKIVSLDKKLAKSVLVRLYYLKGNGLKHFKLFLEKESADKSSILVFKISWDAEE